MNENYRIESKIEVESYLARLKYAIESGATIDIQFERRVDRERKEEYTNRYTLEYLFPDDSPQEAIKQELKKLKVQDYMRTVKDCRYTERSDMREFGKVYEGKDVYIKIRVELLDRRFGGRTTTFVMSFHFAEHPFPQDSFPYA